MNLLEEQRVLEDDGLSAGKDRFERQLQQSIENGTYADQGAARKLLSLGVEKYGKILADMLASTDKRRRTLAMEWVEKVGPEKAAYITLRCAFNGAMKRETIPALARGISKRITDELRYRRLEAEAPALFKYKLSNFATNHYMHRAHSLDAAVRWAEVDVSDLEMSPSDALATGTFLVDRLIEATGLFRIEDGKGVTGRRTKHIVPTEETERWLTERNQVMALMSPVYPCMVVQPLPWGPGRRGGYRFGLRGTNKLVRRASKAHLRALDETPMDPVYKALNTVQNTEWLVNKKVLKVFGTLMDTGGGRAGLASTEPLPDVPKPVWYEPGDNSFKADPEKSHEFYLWRRRQFARHSADVQRNLEVIRLMRLRESAEFYSKYEGIYFPHSLDFRGRMYPIPTALNPQGDDLNKGLLTFATPKPLGPKGAYYLAIHGANVMGVSPWGQKMSKLTLDERVQQIESLTETILRIAQDPIENTDWMTADEPWCYLAFCFEWADMIHWERTEGTRESFPSRLPVASDGTCNGLQHYAALLRDPIAGEAVNVCANSRPKDIYQEVADAVLARLEREAASDPMAAFWLNSGLVNRSLCKRPTMTLAYGATQYGFKDQLIAYLEKDVPKEKLEPFYKWDEHRGDMKFDPHPECVYMAKVIWSSLGDVVVSAQEGMRFFQKYARTIAKAGMNPSWVVPGTGFLVYQNSYKQRIRQPIKTVLCGQVYKPAVYTDTDKVDSFAAANGISPNIIHSLDAAALMMTVNRASDSGVTHFALVHDSYGTHAGDAELLNMELRKAFFELHKRDVLGDLARQFKDQVDAANKKLAEQAAEAGQPPPKLLEFPEVPEKGNLDISQVLVSEYFFC